MSDNTTSTLEKCPHCGLLHLVDSGPCPRIKAIEYYPDGTIKRVEYFAPSTDWLILGKGPDDDR